ncbi:MAG: hypothetical protein QOJ03_3027, partial [Frankiaceae bacterium]|nr:hypothetical protein [Frankiaceae bacterium]
MAILAWTLGLPTVATVMAIGWVHWAARPRGPAKALDSVAEHERFNAAMTAKTVPGRKAS